MNQMTKNEKAADTFTFHGPGCAGCIRHKKAAMISFQVDGQKEIIDLFLDESQVEYLIERVRTEIPFLVRLLSINMDGKPGESIICE